MRFYCDSVFVSLHLQYFYLLFSLFILFTLFTLFTLFSLFSLFSLLLSFSLQFLLLLFLSLSILKLTFNFYHSNYLLSYSLLIRNLISVFFLKSVLVYIMELPSALFSSSLKKKAIPKNFLIFRENGTF